MSSVLFLYFVDVIFETHYLQLDALNLECLILNLNSHRANIKNDYTLLVNTVQFLLKVLT